MAEEERLTKAERRRRRREQREQEEREAARHRLRRRALNGLGTAAVLALVGFVLWQAFLGGTEAITEPVRLTAGEVTEARSAASCEVVDQSTDLSREHFRSLQEAPPAEQLYSVRPSHGGPHPAPVHAAVPRVGEQLSEVATTHNLEHGSVIVWYDPERVDGSTVEAMESWSERLDESGFTNSQGGSGVFVSPYTEPGLAGDAAVAMRAWGIAIDCGRWDSTAADGFVLQYFGTHGIAPEGGIGGFPEDTLVWEGRPLDNGFGAGGGAG